MHSVRLLTLPRTSSVWMLSSVACDKKLVNRKHSKLQHTVVVLAFSSLTRQKESNHHLP